MLICGDLATIAREITIETKECDFPFNNNEHLLLNLEGAVVRDESNASLSQALIVFNCESALLNLASKYKVIAGLSNNHIFDDYTLGENTLNFLEERAISATGARCKNLDLSGPVRVVEDGVIVSVITAGWDVIGCVSRKKHEINQLDEDALIAQVISEKSYNSRIIVYLHWGYELEIYPHPGDRRLAHKLIDAGADVVAGCHSHCMMGVEEYKGRKIFYGLGNFMFTQGYFMKGRIKFPGFSKYGLLLRYSPYSNNTLIYFVSESSGNRSLMVGSQCPQAQQQLDKLSLPLNAATKEVYADFFKINRRKKKLLPIFYNHKKTPQNYLRKQFLKARGFAIKTLFVLGLKKGPQ